MREQRLAVAYCIPWTPRPPAPASGWSARPSARWRRRGGAGRRRRSRPPGRRGSQQRQCSGAIVLNNSAMEPSSSTTQCNVVVVDTWPARKVSGLPSRLASSSHTARSSSCRGAAVSTAVQWRHRPQRQCNGDVSSSTTVQWSHHPQQQCNGAIVHTDTAMEPSSSMTSQWSPHLPVRRRLGGRRLLDQ